MSVKPKRPEGYDLGAVAGRAFERERILAIIDDELTNCECESALQHLADRVKGEK